MDNLSELTDDDRLHLLNNPWKPPKDFSWPYTERKDGNKIRKKYLGLQHLTGSYDCFDYSRTKNGVFCTVCVLFGNDSAGGNKLGKLVKEPLMSFSHLTGRDGYLTEHMRKSFHEVNLCKANNFRQVMASGSNIATQLQSEKEKMRRKNCAVLTRIIKAIEFHGRLGLPLRGHRDSGHLSIQDCNFTQGNFRATLQLMCTSGDSILAEHISSTRKRGTYISPLSQNQLIENIGTVLTRDVVSKLNCSKFFSLLADETTDISGQEQLSICVRFVTPTCSVQERLLCFSVVSDMTGKGLATTLLNILHKSHINTEFMVGQGYDGAAAMSGEFHGVQKYIADECPAATYVHCMSHCLNLCLEKAANIREIKFVITVMREIITFFRDSTKRSSYLKSKILEECPSDSHDRLKKHCPTRWVESQESTQIFRSLYPAILTSLDDFSTSKDLNMAGKSLAFFKSMSSDSFIVSMEVLSVILNVTRPLSEKLQGTEIDLVQALDSVKDCVDVLQMYRNDDTFKRLFETAKQKCGRDIQVPRSVGRQQHRSNPPTESGDAEAEAYSYYRRAVFLPYIDTVLQQLNDRFTSQHSSWQKLCYLLPSLCANKEFSNLHEAAAKYSKFLKGSIEELEAEYHRWQNTWMNREEKDRPKSVIASLKVCKEFGTYPNIETLLHIFATLPVTTATSERSFSCLKYLKSYLRSTMSEPRLNGLALLFVHKDIDLNYEEVIHEFSRKNRLLEFK